MGGLAFGREDHRAVGGGDLRQGGERPGAGNADIVAGDDGRDLPQARLVLLEVSMGSEVEREPGESGQAGENARHRHAEGSRQAPLRA